MQVPDSSSSSMAVARPERLSGAALLLLAVSAIWCVLWFFHALHYWEDDAYIHLEFARSVAAGRGFAFNGQIVYGDTSPLWVYLLVAMHALIHDWMTAGKLLTLCGLLFAGTGAYVYARKVSGSALFGAAMVLLFVVNPYCTYWAFSGMETVTAAGIAFYGASLVSDRVMRWPGFLLACLLVGLAPVTRPEMVFLSGILGLILFYRWVQMPWSVASKLPGLAAGCALAAGPSVAWGIYAVHAFGRLVPNTNAAKRAAAHDSVALRLVNVYSVGFPVIVLVIVAGLVWLLLRWGGRARGLRESRESLVSQVALPVAGWVFIAWSSVTAVFYVVNHTFVQTRYILVSAPGLLFALLAILFLHRSRWARPAWIFGVMAATITSFVATWPFIHNKSEADRAAAQTAAWIRLNLPPDAPMAIYSIGEVAYLSEHPIVDTGAITRPSIIPYLNQHPGDMMGWLRTQGAAYYITGEKPEPGAQLVYSLDAPAVGWYLDPRNYHKRETIRLWKLATSP